jgi:hypothetical protein
MGLMFFGIQSCSKYPDNEGMTLQSKTNRVSNVWEIENYKINGTDYTSLVSGYTETFTEESAYSYQWAFVGGTGTWAFQNKNEEIKITGTNNLETKTLYIMRLEESQFWYYYMDGDDKVEYHLIEQ